MLKLQTYYAVGAYFVNRDQLKQHQIKDMDK